MTNYTLKKYKFPAVKRLRVVSSFEGGDVTSDGGGLFLRMVEKKLNLLRPIAKEFKDARDQSKVEHDIFTMLQQRVFCQALGYEDLNDHNALRKDVAIQAMVGSDNDLASSSTLCRLENTADRSIAWTIHKRMVNVFIDSFDEAPKELVLDFDATDDLVHGNQAGKFFNGYYRNYCFLPLYVFCGKQLLVAYLRRSDRDGARHAWAILSLLAKKLRQAWPDVKIIFRGDSGFCRDKMLEWCDKNNVYYITGVARNKRLEAELLPQTNQAKEDFEQTRIKQKTFAKFSYAAKSWSRERKIIGKAEHSSKGSNPRFIVTNLDGDSQHLYEKVYCARGDMENRIKEMQLGLFSDRTSCSAWWANQLRLLFAALAYVLMEYIRRIALPKTEFENAQMNTIRLRLLKIGAVVTKNTRRICILLSTHFPLKALFEKMYVALTPT